MKTVKECGILFYELPTKFGNLYLKFNIYSEKSFTTLFSKIVPMKDIDSVKEKYNMTEYKESEINKFALGGNKEEENDEQNEGPRQNTVRFENQ